MEERSTETRWDKVGVCRLFFPWEGREKRKKGSLRSLGSLKSPIEDNTPGSFGAFLTGVYIPCATIQI